MVYDLCMISIGGLVIYRLLLGKSRLKAARFIRKIALSIVIFSILFTLVMHPVFFVCALSPKFEDALFVF